jgi:hypothetical protein
LGVPAREQPRQRLHLVAAGEQCEFLGISGAQMRESLRHHAKRFFPGDGLEFASTALRTRLAPQRLRQTRGGILLHDAGSALGADHALIQRMFGIAFDIAHFTAAQRHLDAAAAGAHVAGGGFDFLVRGLLRVLRSFGHSCCSR